MSLVTERWGNFFIIPKLLDGSIWNFIGWYIGVLGRFSNRCGERRSREYIGVLGRFSNRCGERRSRECGKAASVAKPRVQWSCECGEAASLAKPLLRNFAHAQSTRESQRLKRLSSVSIWSLLPYETIWNKRVHLVPAAVWNNMQITEFKNIHKQLRYTLEKNY